APPTAAPRTVPLRRPRWPSRSRDRILHGHRPPPRARSDRVRPPGADLLRLGHVRPHRPRVGRDLDGLRDGPPARGPSAPADGVDSGGARDGAAAVPGGDLARLRIDGAVIAALVCIALTAHRVPLTSSVAKESIGLLVFPMAVLLFHERSDPRKRALAVLLLAFLPFLHSLTTFLTLGTVAALVVLTQRRAPARGRFSWKAFALDVV